MKLDIDLNRIAATVQADMEKQAQDLMQRRVRAQFSTFFDNGQHWGHKKGLGFEMIERILDDLVTDENFEAMVQNRAKTAFQAMLDEQIDYQLRRKAMKVAAQAVRNVQA